MPISAKCPNQACGKAFKAKDEWAGKKTKCPACQTVIVVPSVAGGDAEVMFTPVAANAPSPAAVAAKPRMQNAPAQAQQGGEPSSLESVWKSSPVFSSTQIQVCPHVWQGRYGRNYSLCPPASKDVLGESIFPGSWPLFFLKMCNLADFMPRWLRVSDKQGTLFWMKVVKLVNNRYDVYDPDRKEILFSLKTLFSLKLWLKLLDPKGQDSGDMVTGQLRSPDGKRSFYGFDVRTLEGRKLGDVTNNSNHLDRFGIKASGWSVNRGYVGVVAPEFAKDIRTKAVILAATIVADLEEFGKMEFDPMSVK